MITKSRILTLPDDIMKEAYFVVLIGRHGPKSFPPGIGRKVHGDRNDRLYSRLTDDGWTIFQEIGKEVIRKYDPLGVDAISSKYRRTMESNAALLIGAGIDVASFDTSIKSVETPVNILLDLNYKFQDKNDLIEHYFIGAAGNLQQREDTYIRKLMENNYRKDGPVKVENVFNRNFRFIVSTLQEKISAAHELDKSFDNHHGTGFKGFASFLGHSFNLECINAVVDGFIQDKKYVEDNFKKALPMTGYALAYVTRSDPHNITFLNGNGNERSFTLKQLDKIIF